METVVIFAIAGCLFSAAVMYVVLDYRRHGERQDALENVLSVQAKVASAQKTLLGYTKYIDFLSAGKQAATERMKSLTAKVVREHVHIEKAQKEALNLKSDATVIVKYSAEYLFGFDLKSESFEIIGTTSGIEIRIGKPTLVGSPYVNPLSCDIQSGVVLADEIAAVKEIHNRLPAYAQQHGTEMASEASIRALCEKKLVELLSGFLAVQSGVTQVPVISVVYK